MADMADSIKYRRRAQKAEAELAQLQSCIAELEGRIRRERRQHLKTTSGYVKAMDELLKAKKRIIELEKENRQLKNALGHTEAALDDWGGREKLEAENSELRAVLDELLQ